MQAEDIKELLRKQPFEPLELALSDGRSVLIRHPDQVVIARRHAILGLAQIKRGRTRVTTPADGDSVAKDWMLVDLIHIVSAEPANGQPPTRRGGKSRRRKR
jgi:hypothetical protein